MAAHPDLLALRLSDQASIWHMEVAQIVYRDRKTQFGNVTAAARYHLLNDGIVARRSINIQGK